MIISELIGQSLQTESVLYLIQNALFLERQQNGLLIQQQEFRSSLFVDFNLIGTFRKYRRILHPTTPSRQHKFHIPWNDCVKSFLVHSAVLPSPQKVFRLFGEPVRVYDGCVFILPVRCAFL